MLSSYCIRIFCFLLLNAKRRDSSNVQASCDLASFRRVSYKGHQRTSPTHRLVISCHSLSFGIVWHLIWLGINCCGSSCMLQHNPIPSQVSVQGKVTMLQTRPARLHHAAGREQAHSQSRMQQASKVCSLDCAAVTGTPKLTLGMTEMLCITDVTILSLRMMLAFFRI